MSINPEQQFLHAFPLDDSSAVVIDRSDFLNILYIPSHTELESWNTLLHTIEVITNYWEKDAATCEGCKIFNMYNNMCRFKIDSFKLQLDKIFLAESNPFLSVSVKRDLSTLLIKGNLGIPTEFWGELGPVNVEIPFVDYSTVRDNPNFVESTTWDMYISHALSRLSFARMKINGQVKIAIYLEEIKSEKENFANTFYHDQVQFTQRKKQSQRVIFEKTFPSAVWNVIEEKEYIITKTIHPFYSVFKEPILMCVEKSSPSTTSSTPQSFTESFIESFTSSEYLSEGSSESSGSYIWRKMVQKGWDSAKNILIKNKIVITSLSEYKLTASETASVEVLLHNSVTTSSFVIEVESNDIGTDTEAMVISTEPFTLMKLNVHTPTTFSQFIISDGHSDIDFLRARQCDAVTFTIQSLKNILERCHITPNYYIPLITLQWTLTYIIAETEFEPVYFDSKIRFNFYMSDPNNDVIVLNVPIFYFPGMVQTINIPISGEFSVIEMDYLDIPLCFDAFIFSKSGQILGT